ncbi:MAG TPA: SRPBCC family protein [Chitinophagaceae bacterium]|nr:SRPBCC family protein [Chitinophagaceae bacterium]
MIFVYIFLGLIICLLVVAALLPGTYHIEKTFIIKKPVSEVMEKVGDLNHYAKWNPWQQMDPTAKQEITGAPRTPGHQYSWKGKKIGIGSLTLKSIDAKSIQFLLEFIKPWKSLANDNWLFEPWSEDETKVTWQNNGKLPWPIARLMGPLINKNLNHQFDTGLNNLRQMCEA